jgi:predicted short-subunit dehydrogenase-like oxidoreductase (DUF2520 family)
MLDGAGYEVRFLAIHRAKADKKLQALASRLKARMVAIGRAPLATEVVWIAVPDDAIGGVAERLAKSQEWRGRIAVHSSGALTSDELAPLREKGAHVASAHPMMTFVRGVIPEIANVAFAIEGDRMAVRAAKSMVRDLGGKPFVIRKQNKVLYHAFGSFASPLLMALMASAEQVARAAGIRQADIKSVMRPLLLQTLHNYLNQDAASAFSGPLVRGDVATVRKHLDQLKKVPEAKAAYNALAGAALNLLPVKNRSGLQKELRRR